MNNLWANKELWQWSLGFRMLFLDLMQQHHDAIYGKGKWGSGRIRGFPTLSAGQWRRDVSEQCKARLLFSVYHSVCRRVQRQQAIRTLCTCDHLAVLQLSRGKPTNINSTIYSWGHKGSTRLGDLQDEASSHGRPRLAARDRKEQDSTANHV